MRVPIYIAIAVGASIPLGSCASLPNMPPDYALPIAEILLHTTCELRFAFHSLAQHNSPSFQAANWAMAIALTPKVDAEIIPAVGLTGKSSLTAKFFNSWAIAAPGIQLDVKGHRDGSITYNIHARDLLDDAHFPLNCDTSTPNYHVLSQHLGIREWLVRAVLATDGDISALAKLDKPTFASEIFIKFTGAGNFTYNFPLGTDFASLSANYTLDEVLSIALTPDPQKVAVRMLPSGGDFRGPTRPAIPTRISPEAQYRLDQLQLEQTLRNLQIRVEP